MVENSAERSQNKGREPESPPPFPRYPSPEHFDVVSRRDPAGATQWLNSLHEQSRQFQEYARRMRETGQATTPKLILFEVRGKNGYIELTYECLSDQYREPTSIHQEMYVRDHLLEHHYLDNHEISRLLSGLIQNTLDFREEVRLGVEAASLWQRARLLFMDTPLYTRSLALERLEEVSPHTASTSKVE